MSWFKKDFGGVDDAIRDQERSRKPNRLWLAEKTEKQIVFVDDEGFSFYEHQLKINDDWRNWFSCLRQMGKNCPLCDSGYNRYYVTMFTVVDLSEWTDKKGVKHVNELRLLALKPDVASIVKRKKATRNGSLVGCMFKVFRSSGKDYSSGSDFEFIDKVDLQKFSNPKPFEYEKLFAPLTPEQLSNVMGARQASSGNAKKADGVEADEAIPY